MKSLREIASSSGRPSSCRRVELAAAAAIVCAGVLAKSGPGVDDQLLARHAARRSASAMRSRRKASTSPVTSVVEIRVLQPLARRRARVHQHERRAGLARTRRPAPGRAGR